MDPLNEPEILQALRGVRRVVINTCHGGFGLSYCARIAYLHVSSTPYHVRDHRDHDWSRDGPQIWVAGQPMDDRTIARDDRSLVWVVEHMGQLADGLHARLKIVDIPWSVDWIIQEYDGWECVAERHRTWQ